MIELYYGKIYTFNRLSEYMDKPIILKIDSIDNILFLQTTKLTYKIEKTIIIESQVVEESNTVNVSFNIINIRKRKLIILFIEKLSLFLLDS